MYISPTITQESRIRLKEVLAKAPEDIRESSGASTLPDSNIEPNYGDIKSQKVTAEAILSCNDLEENSYQAL